MEAKELRGMTAEELVQKRSSLREEVSHLLLKRATGRLESPMKVRDAKRDLARVETVIREQMLQAEKGA